MRKGSVCIYGIDLSITEEILCYHDIYNDEHPNLQDEIQKLNMHKTISIICELINAREYEIEVNNSWPLKMKLPFELAMKKVLCGINAASPDEMVDNPLLRKDKHIISLQMLLILLKKVIIYGDYSTLEKDDYKISIDDYSTIVKLQLLVDEEFDQQFDEDAVDMNHFVYGTFHVNYDRNVASEFLRSYYIFERLTKGKNIFDIDVQKEYRNYYAAFYEKYGYTPTQYLSLLFWELSGYYPPKNALIYNNIWRNIEKIYGKTGMREVGGAVISDLSQKVIDYQPWAKETENRMWDFRGFIGFPFLNDSRGNYISISEYTLKNTFFEKLFWMVKECYPQEDRAMAFYGRLYERYIQDLTESAIRKTSNLLYIPEFEYEINKNKKKSSDAYIREGEKLLIVEAKGYSILINSLIANEDIQRNNEKLFVNPIIQADTRFYEIDANYDRFDGIKTVYILSVTMDSVSAVPSYLYEIHKEIFLKKKSGKTKYVYNLNIEEYEMLMYLAENNISIFDILTDYFNEKNIVPFVTYLHKHIKGKIKMTEFMNTIYQEASKTMKSLYEFENVD